MEKVNFLVCCMSVLITGTTTSFAENTADFEVTGDFFGKYIWRGQNLNDDPVFQPGFSTSYKGLTAGIWGSLELTNINGNSSEFTEVDYSIDYSADIPGIEGVGFSVGAIYYDFPSTTVDGTAELYWGLSLDVLLSPSITFYHDVDEAEGLYASFSIGHSIEKIFELGLDVPVGMELGASLGWGDSSYNEFYWGIEESKANDIALSVSFPFEIAGFTVAPSVNYVTLASSEIRDTDAYSTNNNYFFAGIGVAKGF